MSPPAKTFTPKQGQYLAFIYAYTRLHRRPPTEADMQLYFRVSPPSVHQMILTLERAGFIRRQPRVAQHPNARRPGKSPGPTLTSPTGQNLCAAVLVGSRGQAMGVDGIGGALHLVMVEHEPL